MMTETEHPAKDVSQAARAAFERIAVNQPSDCTWQELDELLEAKLIERGPSETRKDAMGIFSIPSFYVPLPLHQQWCEWRSWENERQRSMISEQKPEPK